MAQLRMRTDLVGTPDNPVPTEAQCFLIRTADGVFAA